MDKKQRLVIITGANSGIGKAAAIRFASEGDQVIMACRNMQKGERAREEVLKAVMVRSAESETGSDNSPKLSGNRMGPADEVEGVGFTESVESNVVLMELDISSFQSIRNFTDAFRSRFDRLDLMIHNAAYFNHGSPYKLSDDGIELTFATNLVGPWLLTRLLQDRLNSADHPGVLFAGSNIIKNFFNPKKKIDLNNLKGEHPDDKSFKVYNNYRDSKMALLMITFRLAEQLKNEGFSFYYLQINGATMSKETLAKFTTGYRVVAWIQNLFFRPPEFMADLYYEICTSERFRQISGACINHRLEMMEPGPKEPGGKDQIRQVFGASFYPLYAHDRGTSDKILKFCKEVTGLHAERENIAE